MRLDVRVSLKVYGEGQWRRTIAGEPEGDEGEEPLESTKGEDKVHHAGGGE